MADSVVLTNSFQRFMALSKSDAKESRAKNGMYAKERSAD